MTSLTEQEFQALASLLQRTPMTGAEMIGVNVIIAKLQPLPPTPQKVDNA